MKHLLLLALLAAPVMADEPPTQTEIDLLCEDVHGLAVKIHETRYSNVPLQDVLRITTSDTWREIIIEAYSLPRYSTERRIMEDRREFALKKQLECLRTDWS